MNKYTEIGSRLKDFAVKKYGSVAELERILGVNRAYLSQYVTGRNKPGAKLLNELRLLHADIDYIMTGKRNVVLEVDHETRVGIYSRFKYFVEKQFKGEDKFAKELNINLEIIDDHLWENVQPKYGLIRKLAELGCDINWLLLGDKLGNVVKENAENYYAGTTEMQQRVKKLEYELTEMKATMYDLILSCSQKDRQIEELESKNRVLSLNLSKGNKGKTMM